MASFEKPYSSVAVFNLAHTVDLDGKTDPLLDAAGARILLRPLAQLLRRQRVTPTAPTLYLIENPQVFEEVVANVPHSPDFRAPTVIWTSGWLGMAVMKLLDLLAQDASDHHFYYSGDFDLKGLQIATYLSLITNSGYFFLTLNNTLPMQVAFRL